MPCSSPRGEGHGIPASGVARPAGAQPRGRHVPPVLGQWRVVSQTQEILALVVVIALAGVGLLVGLLRSRGGKDKQLPPQAPSAPPATREPSVGDESAPPRDTPKRTVETSPGVDLLEPPVVEPAPTPTVETPAPAVGRLQRLRARLARSNTAMGQGLLSLLSRGGLDEQAWEDVEDTLLTSDLGVEATTELVDSLRTRVKVEGATDEATVRGWLREDLLRLVDPTLDRTVVSSRVDGRPAVVMVVGVNGTGKTTTVGKLARVLVAEDKDVVLGAADTFRAGAELEADVVLIDTAGRLHNKVGVMDELGKVKRVIEKQSPIDEVLLVLDATTGQNGLRQAEVFAEVVKVTGIVLTKLDGTAKGGIVVSVQRKLRVPVKLVGLGEGPDDLAPFDPAAFVDALID